MSADFSLVSIVGARPQFIKLAPLARTLEGHTRSPARTSIKHSIVHTGQHYDYLMDKIFFDDLRIPEPDYNLEVGSSSHSRQTGKILIGIEEILQKIKPDLVLVYGDTNSTIAGALAAAKLHIPVAHVEAGLRSYNKNMPEEINRILTDHCSDVLFVPTTNAYKILTGEGFRSGFDSGELFSLDTAERKNNSISFPLTVNVGDIMYDSMLMAERIAEEKSDILNRLQLKTGEYFLATVHRPENTDDPIRLRSILEALHVVNRQHPVIFPVHPRTKKKLTELKNSRIISENIRMLDPVSYFDMLALEKNAKMILTDSGGMQKEAFFLKVPCTTLRDETEWVETLEGGCNVLTGADKETIVREVFRDFPDGVFSKSLRPFGDGHCADRILAVILFIKDALPGIYTNFSN